MNIAVLAPSEIPARRARVPGSVQETLRQAGILPDWNEGLNYRLCEWVENRHWIYQADLPDAWLAEGKTFRLRCDGLDDNGVVFLNGQEPQSAAQSGRISSGKPQPGPNMLLPPPPRANPRADSGRDEGQRPEPAEGEKPDHLPSRLGTAFRPRRPPGT